MTFDELLVDSHCHLTLDAFEEDLPSVLSRARETSVARILIPGIDLPSSQRAVALAEETPGLFAAVGVHPHNASSWRADIAEKLRALATSPAVVAIGEIGLDFYRDHSSPEEQQRAFAAQLELACDLELPVIVHLRQSAEEVLEAVGPWSHRLPSALNERAGVLHAFSGDEGQGLRAVDAGFFLGVAGPITYQGADRRRATTQQLPPERLLVETDAPYMSPHPHRGERNEPAYVRLVAAGLARTTGASLNQIATQTTHNAATLFDWNHGTSNRNLL